MNEEQQRKEKVSCSLFRKTRSLILKNLVNKIVSFTVNIEKILQLKKGNLENIDLNGG